MSSTSSVDEAQPATRSERLRGLAYLRCYTHHHLHAHLSHSASPPQDIGGSALGSDSAVSGRRDSAASTGSASTQPEDVRIGSPQQTGVVQQNRQSITLLPLKHQDQDKVHTTDESREERRVTFQGPAIILGRYSRKRSVTSSQPQDSSEPRHLGLKSRVISKSHCEVRCEDSKWFVKDLGSSSGTFVNGKRLSKAGLSSELVPIKSGDVLQVGQDAAVGEGPLFRCVRVSVICST